MAFCSNCGNQLGDGAQFCPSCGTPAGAAASAVVPPPPPAVPPRPVTEKVGNIRKCPACGEPVESFQTRCSGCGHEFSGVKAADSVRGFFDKIAEISEQDDVKETDKKGNDKKIKAFRGMLIGLFIMNIIINSVWMSFTLIAASIALALVIGLIMFTRKVEFSAADNTKKNLITNFPIPNAKEDLLEFMILSSSQIASAHGLSYAARKQQAWNNIWIVKCRQVFSKAEILFASDKQSLETVRNNQNKVEEIIASEKNLKIAVVTLIVIFLVIAAGKIVIDKSGILIVCDGYIPRPLGRKKGMYPEANTLPKQQPRCLRRGC